MERLLQDVSPQNTYREASYLSISGGGSGGVPLLFAVDVHENRQQRMQQGKLLRLCGIIERGDWILSIHVAGGFYRSLDLTTETMENAGGTLLSGGGYMTPEEVIKALIDFKVNGLTGDGSQVIQIVCHIAALSKEQRARIRLNKIIYTSEPLTNPQRALVRSTLPEATIYSCMGSSEAGPWAVSNPNITGKQNSTHESNGIADFIFDTRSMHIEIMPSALLDPNTANGVSLSASTSALPAPLPMGEPGIIVQTSLQRLRNPLVRYVTGDIGSLHPLPESAGIILTENERQYLRVLRMYGRDRRFSFKWYGSYIELETMRKFMEREDYNILQWQVILDQLDSSPQITLEVRVLQSTLSTRDELAKRMRHFFVVLPENEHLFRLVFLESLDGFERSSTAGKILHFIDRLH